MKQAIKVIEKYIKELKKDQKESEGTVHYWHFQIQINLLECIIKELEV